MHPHLSMWAGGTQALQTTFSSPVRLARTPQPQPVMLLRDDGEPLRHSGKLTPQQAQAAQTTRLDGDVHLITTTSGEQLVPIIIGHLCGYYVLEVRRERVGSEPPASGRCCPASAPPPPP